MAGIITMCAMSGGSDMQSSVRSVRPIGIGVGFAQIFCGLLLAIVSLLLLASLTLLTPLVPLGAYQLKSQRFEPDKYYIGEHVRMILEVEVSPAELGPGIFHSYANSLESSSPDGKSQGRSEEKVQEKLHGQLQGRLRVSDRGRLPDNLSYRIHSLNIFPAGVLHTYVVEISYAVFTTEIGRISAFEIEGFTIPQLTIPRALSSLTKDGRSPDVGNNPIDQGLPSLESTPLSLPRVDLTIALLIQVVVLLPIFLLQSSRRLRLWAGNLRQKYLHKRPYRQFLRQLNMLQQKEDLSVREYYRILSSQVRYYLGHRTRHPCSAYTTEELSRLNMKFLAEPQKLWQQVLAVLRAGDDLRFRGGDVPGRGQDGQSGQSDSPAHRTPGLVPVSQMQKDREVGTIIQFAKLIERQYQKKQQELLHV
ncbi:hypothetical protein P0082_02960 [Candidatus Haliotispira prima]|uniref:Uncharacterized protein n=1 Tax=Candidatus Haliotispira prima TaxID=3034016 RepID=A0ABY8MIJ6_9SPIO|nr:hypothetical protein P0082_02960 [Candidatus Haliotispira prima]